MTVFIGFLLLIQLQSLFAHRRAPPYLRSTPPSPAHEPANDSGPRHCSPKHSPSARRSTQVPSTALGGTEPPRARRPDRHLPQPFPRGNPANEYLLTILLIRFGRGREAAEYSADGFAEEPTPIAACGVARAAAALGDGATAAAWLRTALDRGLPVDQLAALVNTRRSPRCAATRLFSSWSARDVADVDASPHVGERGVAGDRRDLADRRAVRVVRVGDRVARLGALATSTIRSCRGACGPAGVHPLDELLAGIAALREVDGDGDDGDLGRDPLAGDDLGAHRRPAGLDPGALVVVERVVGADAPRRGGRATTPVPPPDAGLVSRPYGFLHAGLTNIADGANSSTTAVRPRPSRGSGSG